MLHAAVGVACRTYFRKTRDSEQSRQGVRPWRALRGKACLRMPATAPATREAYTKPPISRRGLSHKARGPTTPGARLGVRP